MTKYDWFEVALYGVICAAIAGFILLLVAAPGEGATLRLTFTAPDTYADNGAYCGLPDSTIIDPLTGSFYLGSPMRSLQSIRLYGYLFNPTSVWGPEPTLRDTVDARGMEGQRLTMDVEITPGTMGFLWLTAVNAGMESCGVGGYTFALPMADSTTAANYELIWRKP